MLFLRLSLCIQVPCAPGTWLCCYAWIRRNKFMATCTSICAVDSLSDFAHYCLLIQPPDHHAFASFLVIHARMFNNIGALKGFSCLLERSNIVIKLLQEISCYQQSIIFVIFKNKRANCPFFSFIIIHFQLFFQGLQNTSPGFFLILSCLLVGHNIFFFFCRLTLIFLFAVV